MLLALRCFHSICENCEALLIAKTDLSAAIHHGLAHLAASRASRCITRVAQLIICFRVARLYFSARVLIRAARVVAAPRHTLTYPTWRNCAVAPRERSTSSRAAALSTPRR